MTYETHTQNILPPGDISEGGIATGNLRAILRMLEEHMLMGGEDAIGAAIRVAATYSNLGKCCREMDVHNFTMREKNLKALQEKNTYDPDNTPSPEDDAAARAALADALYRLQHSAVNEAAVERYDIEHEPPAGQ